MNAKGFFLRFDIIRTICRSLLVLLMIILFFARSWSLGTVGIIFFVTSVTVCTLGSVLRVPKPAAISEFLSNERRNFEAEVRKENKNFRMGDSIPFYAYSPQKGIFARALGQRLIYPICLNMMFLPHGDGGSLIVGNLSLWDKNKPTKEKYVFERLTVVFLRMEGDAEILAVSFLEHNEEKISFLVKDDHFWRSFLFAARQNCRVREMREDSESA